MSILDEAINKIVDQINEKRRSEIIQIYNNTDLLRELHKVRLSGEYNHGNKSKSMRKVAEIPFEVDQFFSKVYGRDYYKDKDFFNKYAPEWKVISKT